MDKQINKGKGNGMTPCWITCLDYKRLSVQSSVEQETKEEEHKNSTRQPECGVSYQPPCVFVTVGSLF